MSSVYQGVCNGCYNVMQYGSTCKFCGNPLDLIKKREKTSLNREQLEAIQLVEGVPGQGNPFGSFIFKVQSYPSDLDVIEQVTECCDTSDVYNKMNTLMKNIIRKVLNTKNAYISEVKTGKDELYDFIPKKIQQYDYGFIKHYIDELYEKKLLNNTEVGYLNNIVKSDISQDEFDKLKEFFRKKYTLRWKPEDVLKGSMKLPGGRVLKYIDALEHKATIKIDVFYPINGRYIEVTNFFVLVLTNETGTHDIFLNVTFDYANQIKEEIKKYNSRTFYKQFKMAKRMWGLARYLKNYNDLETLTPLFRSGVAILNQIAGEVETMILMLQNIPNPPLKQMLRQIDESRSRISFIYEFDFNEINIDDMINDIVHSRNKGEQIKKLEYLQKYLKNIINVKTIEYLKDVGLYPVPSFYLPLEGSGIKDLALSAFKNTSNFFRKKFCSGKARPLYQGEIHPQCQNFTGPGTRIDLPDVLNYTPYNNIEACSKVYDLEYNEIDKIKDPKEKMKQVRFADEKVLKCYDKYPKEQAHNLAKFFISNKVNLENISPSIIKKILGEAYTGSK